jgi:hypothetical protein
MTDIVERLRQFDPETFGRVHAWEAADEIERLCSTVSRLISASQAEYANYRWSMKELRAEIERLRKNDGLTRAQVEVVQQLTADVERLRAALHNIGIGGNGDRNWTLDEVRAVAWDALEPES